MKKNTLHILITDDHATTRMGIKQILREKFPDAVIGEAADAAGTLRQLAKSRWDLLILDISLPDTDGLAVLAEVKKKFPALPVLVFSVHPEDQFALRAVKLGASGYLAKERAPEDLGRAVQQILEGGAYLSRASSQQMLSTLKSRRSVLLHENLSAREFQVLRLIGTGKAGKLAASELGLSQKTIATYRARVLKKLGMSTTSELIRYALREGLV